MTASDHRKVLKQIQNKPAKYARWKKHNTPKERKSGEASKKCSRCNRTGGHISKYGLNLCRQCFRDIATRLGFKKYN